MCPDDNPIVGYLPNVQWVGRENLTLRIYFRILVRPDSRGHVLFIQAGQTALASRAYGTGIDLKVCAAGRATPKLGWNLGKAEHCVKNRDHDADSSKKRCFQPSPSGRGPNAEPVLFAGSYH